MKDFNKQIVEAVSRGIQLALDDIQDNEQINSTSHINDVIDSDDVIKDAIELHKYFEDLGLPSRTLWGKYNLGADINSEDPNKKFIGGYYSWGEIKPKKEFTVAHYKYGDLQRDERSTKYNSNDEIQMLTPEDDAVRNYFKNDHYHMPTVEQAQELIDNTELFEVREGNQYLLGIKDYPYGWMLISKINGKMIFIPDTGIKEGRHLINSNIPKCGLWLLNVNTHTSDSNDTCAETLAFNKNLEWVQRKIYIYGQFKYRGLQIRPVYNR